MKFKSINHKNKKPIYVLFEITRNCNLNCEYCTYDRLKQDMNLNLIKNCIDKISKIDKDIDIDFMGGEVTLHPNLKEIIEYSLKKLKNSTIYISTNLTRPLNFFKNLIKDLDVERIIFYTTYHHSQNVNEFKEKIDYLTSKGSRIYLKFLCEPNLEIIKETYNKLIKTDYEKFFIKYLWKYRRDNLYSKECLKWMEESTIENDDIFVIDWGNELKEYSYKELKKENLDIFTDYYCPIYSHLTVNILGEITSTCFRDTNTLIQKNKIGNIFMLQDLNSIFDKCDELHKCPNIECTELFLNPFKCQEL